MTPALGLLLLMAVVGCALHLPFFVWFRFRRKQSKAIVVETRPSLAGLFHAGLWILVILLGPAARYLVPESWAGTLMRMSSSMR